LLGFLLVWRWVLEDAPVGAVSEAKTGDPVP
jgi:hypothetical protein